jgi:hypothetical protein
MNQVKANNQASSNQGKFDKVAQVAIELKVKLEASRERRANKKFYFHNNHHLKALHQS